MKLAAMLLSLALQCPSMPCVPHPSLAANNISVINGCAKSYNISGTSFPLNIGSTGPCANSGLNPGVGHFILLPQIFTPTQTGYGVTDTLSNSWTSQACGLATSEYSWSTFTSGGADTVTPTTSNSVSDIVIDIDLTGVISYGGGGNPFDGGVANVNCNNFAATTTWAAPSVTTTNANDLIVSCVGSYSNNPGIGSTLNGFTDLAGAGTASQVFECGYKKVTATGTYNGGYNVTGSATAYVGITFAVKSS